MAGKVKQLSEEEKASLRDKAKTELERLESLMKENETKKMVEDFKTKFGICEIVYKVILEDHQFNKNGKHETRLQVDMKQVPHALKYAGYSFDKSFLSTLFGGCDKKNSRSVKKLRDALTHNMSEDAIQELRDRNVELNGYMDSFLEAIRHFDDK